MAEFKLGRIRFVWKGDWAAATTYVKDDVIKYGGRTYICQIGHTSNSNFYTDKDFVPTKWNQMTDGQEWRGDWATSTFYSENDVVKYGGLLYIAVNSHTSAATTALGLEANVSDWELFAEGFDWKGAWTTSTRYKENDLVKYGGYTYVCNTAHTSASTSADGLELDQSNWDTFNPGIEYRSSWSASSVRYKLNDVVEYGAGLWICVTPHTSGGTFASQESNWNQFVKGIEFENEWNGSTTYQPGDIVRYGGNQYISKTNQVNAVAPNLDGTNWDLFAEGFNWASAWDFDTNYKIGDVASVGGYSYLALQNVNQITLSVTATDSSNNRFTTSSTSNLAVGMLVRFSGSTFGNIGTNDNYYVRQIPSGTTFTVSITPGGAEVQPTTATGTMTAKFTAHPNNTTYWNVLNKGIQWRGTWTEGTNYDLGDAILFGANSYICVLKHKAEQDDGSTIRAEGGGHPNSRPDQDISGTYWNVLAVGSETSVLTTRGDLVYYGDAGPTRLPVGLEGQVLRVSDDLIPEWVTLGGQDYTYYVATNGTDGPAPVHGLSFDKPFKTIRYACEQVEKGPRNPNAKHLLEMNRVFIQREVTEFIQWQIANASVGSIWENFEYEDYKCERDVGLVVDALMYDLSHGGNVKTRGAANTLVGGITEDSPGAYPGLSVESDQSLAAYAYMLQIVTKILNQEAPTINYQALNGDNSTAVVEQFFNQDKPSETTSLAEITSLVSIITNAITDGTPDNIPARYSPNNLIRVATGDYREVLPIIVPEQTCINGAELRSTSAGPRVGTTASEDSKYSIAALGRMKAIVGDIITGGNVTETSGNSEIQSTDFPFADTPQVTFAERLVRTIQHRIDFKLGTLNLAYTTDPVGYNSSYLIGYGNARKLVKENKKFLQEEVKAYLIATYPNLKYSKTKCYQDVGYIIDALVYDLTYGGNAASVQAGLAYYEGVGSSLYIDSTEKTATIAAYEFLKSRIETVANNTGFTPLNDQVSQYRDTAGSAGAITALGNNLDDIIEIIDTGPSAVGTTVTLSDPAATDGVSSTTALINAYSTLNSAVSTIQTDTINYINTNYPELVYDEDKCSRDVATVLKAVGYDFQLNSNWQTVKAGYSYLRETAQEVYQLNQKTATRDALEFVRTQAVLSVNSDATAISRINALMEILDDILYSGSNEGSPCATEERNDHYAVLQLERNRDYIVAELNAYIADTFNDTATATTASTKAITISDTSWLVRNTAVRFGSAIGGLETGVTYYVQKILSSTTFTVALTRFAIDADQIAVTNDTGSVAVALYFNAALCTRDINTYIDALKYDIKYPGNYKSLFAARYYANSVLGSLEEDMYYLRDATGIRDQTLTGLSGDLTPENAYGTSRVTAGAYCSLDPGWGPDDFRTWIITRSPYVQGLTTFGNAAIGQKIDGALHNGGNDSIVSNDFTQVISDGIGAWVANNGRAELVSVFTYYSHIGYLCTEGGRIRGTNGNNSYGDFGSVAEGFDATEIPNTAAVDNRFQFVSTVHIINNDGDEMLNYEFENAGIDYTEATWTMTGGGISAVTSADEFRDNAVYQVRLLDFGNDSSGQFGGEGYLTNSNTSQGGGSTFVTLAATDGELSTAYVGMKVILTAGAGAGQFGIITTYNSGTKRADVVKESDGTSGWDHFVPGTLIAVPDASTTYTVEPRITFSAPAFTSSQQTLPSSAAWTAVAYGETAAIYTGVSGTYSGTGGAGATFDVTRNGWKYIVSVNVGGTDYTRLETITIPGTSLGGLSPENDLVITITAIDSGTGAVVLFDQDGYGSGGRFVAVRGSSTTAGAYSNDGATWAASTMPSGTWTGVAAGLIEDGSTLIKVSRFVAIGTGTSAAYSADGINWNASVMPTSATWSSVVYAEGKFVAIASDSTTVAISLDGEVWDFTGTLTSTGFVDITYGKGMFVAVKTASNVVATSGDGETWSDETLPATTNWNSVAWGNGRFVAISTSSNSGAFSLDGETWTAMTLGPIDGSTTTPSAGYQTVRYGQGLFMATTYITGFGDYAYVATSEDGIFWTIRGVDGKVNSTAGFDAIAFGNPQRTPTWVVLDKDTSDEAVKISAGARARGRAYVAQTKIFLITILEPGSGYTSTPTMTITDPTNLYEAPFTVRTGSGVLANPTFLNRGTGYATSGAEINTGDGYADNYQTGGFVAVRRLSARPVPGSNVVFAHLPDRTFKLVNVITFLGTVDGSYTAFFQVSPILEVSDSPDHLTSISTRIRYSQVRLTGHDFLDIGTGGFTDSNYPGTPLNNPNPANETVGNNGGRVFFTSTDQDGNFRVGDLFAIEQSTGIATLNADAFNISGLQELNLGNVTLGGGSATITEFSTDPFFTADSDNVVPTQRAIKAYISAQIGGGGASLNVNSVTAGSIFISSNVITTTTAVAIKMNTTFEFRGGVTGAPLAFNYYFK